MGTRLYLTFIRKRAIRRLPATNGIYIALVLVLACSKKRTDADADIMQTIIRDETPPKRERSGAVIRHPVPAPTKSAQYILPAWVGKYFNSRARQSPLKKNGMAIKSNLRNNRNSFTAVSWVVIMIDMEARKLAMTDRPKKRELHDRC